MEQNIPISIDLKLLLNKLMKRDIFQIINCLKLNLLKKKIHNESF